MCPNGKVPGIYGCGARTVPVMRAAAPRICEASTWSVQRKSEDMLDRLESVGGSF